MGLFFAALDFLDEQSAKEIIQEGLDEALGTMESMVGNEGQQVIFDEYVIEAFTTNAQANVEDGWEDVDIGDYMDFMGEIVEEGNNIMQAAYDYAQEVGAAGSDFSEDGGDDPEEVDFEE